MFGGERGDAVPICMHNSLLYQLSRWARSCPWWLTYLSVVRLLFFLSLLLFHLLLFVIPLLFGVVSHWFLLFCFVLTFLFTFNTIISQPVRWTSSEEEWNQDSRHSVSNIPSFLFLSDSFLCLCSECRSLRAYSHQQQSVLPQLLRRHISTHSQHTACTCRTFMHTHEYTNYNMLTQTLASSIQNIFQLNFFVWFTYVTQKQIKWVFFLWKCINILIYYYILCL